MCYHNEMNILLIIFILLNTELFVVADYLLVTMPGLSCSICSLVSLCGVLGSAGLAFVTFFLGFLFLELNKKVYFWHELII